MEDHKGLVRFGRNVRRLWPHRHLAKGRTVMSQKAHYEKFLALHHREGGFIMPNPWDGLSALILKAAGFEAFGTSSAAFASALGRVDGRHSVSMKEHLEHAKLLG